MFSPRLLLIVGKLIGPLVKLSLLLIIGTFVYFTYNYINDKLIELDNAKITISKQADQITQLQLEVKKSIESNKITVLAIENIKKQEAVIKEKVVYKTIKVNEKLNVIKATDLPKVEKENQMSIVYIDDLNSTYCIIDPDSCKETLP